MRPRVAKNGPPESRKKAIKQPRHHFRCIRHEPDKSEAIFLPMTWPQPQPLQPSGDLLHGALRYCLPFLPVTCCLRQDCRPNRYHAIICSQGAPPTARNLTSPRKTGAVWWSCFGVRFSTRKSCFLSLVRFVLFSCFGFWVNGRQGRPGGSVGSVDGGI